MSSVLPSRSLSGEASVADAKLVLVEIGFPKMLALSILWFAFGRYSGGDISVILDPRFINYSRLVCNRHCESSGGGGGGVGGGGGGGITATATFTYKAVNDAIKYRRTKPCLFN